MFIDTRVKLRRQIRQQRRSLSTHQQQESANLACKNTARLPVFSKAERIACYIPADGELDPLPVLERAVNMGKECFLPVLRPVKRQRLWFARWRPGDALGTNKFGIPEPLYCYNNLIPAWALDLVLTPLVAFDEDGNRLGMGGGYYDRTFAFLRYRKHWRKPVLAGYAHAFQNSSQLHGNEWDIPLDMVITEKKVYVTNR